MTTVAQIAMKPPGLDLTQMISNFSQIGNKNIPANCGPNYNKNSRINLTGANIGMRN